MEGFPFVHPILLIKITLPETIASSGRSFFSLQCLKTYLKNTTGENGSNNLEIKNILCICDHRQNKIH